MVIAMNTQKIIKALGRHTTRLHAEMHPDAFYIADAHDIILELSDDAWLPCFSQIEAEEGQFIAMGNDPALAESMAFQSVFVVDEFLSRIVVCK